MTATFEERAVIVTGSGGGIGRATALSFASRGALVTAVDNDRTADSVVVEIRRSGGRAHFCLGDVTDESDVRRAVEEAFEQWGRLDVLVNVVGGSRPGKTVVEMERSDWEKTVSFNLTSVFLTSKHAIPHIAATGGGSIVNVASSAAIYGSPANPAYVAAKGGVIALTRAMAIDHAPQGIRVNCVAPGSTRTALTLGNKSRSEIERMARTNLLGRLADPSELAETIAFLASESSSFVTGQTLSVDAGRGLGGRRS